LKNKLLTCSEGYYAINPDCCDDFYNGSLHVNYPEFSDADPGL